MKKLALLISTALALAIMPTTLVMAAPALCTAGATSSAYCKGNTTTDPIAGSHGILIRITDLIAVVAGIAMVVIIIVAGIRYITSGGDSNGVQKAKNTIIDALIGLTVILLARSLIALIVNSVLNK